MYRREPLGGLKRAYRAVVGGDGRATVEITPATSVAWNVTQVSIELASAPAGATCTLRQDGAFITALVPTGDAAGGDPPVLIQPGEVMTVVWEGCAPQTVGTVLVLYDEAPDR